VEALEDRLVPITTSLSAATLATRVPFTSALAEHWHVQLQITIDNTNVVIPADIGVGQTDATLIHTHTNTGMIHIESPFSHDYVLGDFLYIWGQYSSQGQEIVYDIDNARTLTITDNNVQVSLDGLVLHDHDNITVQVTTRNDAFINQAYNDLLHRNPDSDGMANFLAFLATGNTRMQVVEMIVNSTEYRTNVVEDLYHTLLQRDADASGLNTFVTFLASGGTVEQAKAAILGSAEFYNLVSGTDASWIQAVYGDVLNRPADVSGAQSWQAALTGGTSRQQVALDILGSTEAMADRVTGYYQTYYGRNLDDSGRATFVTALSSGMTDAQVIACIVGSEEYFGKLAA
jgi:hypothetical protein